MATCLRCDSCGAVVPEEDDDLAKWWRIERYGSEWIDEPRRKKPEPVPHIMMESVIMDTRGEEVYPIDVEIEPDPEFMEEMMSDFMEETGGIAIGMILHFCKSSCLAEWSAQATAFED